MSIVISPITEEVSIYVDPNTEKVYVEITETAIGIPKGGTTGQVLAKASNTNYDTEWVSGGAGGGAAWGDITGTLTDQTDLQAELNLKVDKVTGKGLSQEDYTTAEKSKLAGIATGATANQTDAYLLARANHTGTQLAATISDFGTAVSANSDVAANTAARHVHSNFSLLQTITEAFTTVLKTAYDSAVTWISTNGTNLINHLSNTSNPHGVTKSQVGLGNVDNTADADKPVSTATQTALNTKQATIVTYESVLTSPVTLTLASAWYSGPELINLPSGTYLISCHGTCGNAVGAARYAFRLWDGTNSLAGAFATHLNTASRNGTASFRKKVTLAGTTTLSLQARSNQANSSFLDVGELDSVPGVSVIIAEQIS